MPRISDFERKNHSSNEKQKSLLDYLAKTTAGVDYFDRYMLVAQKMINSFELTESK